MQARQEAPRSVTTFCILPASLSRMKKPSGLGRYSVTTCKEQWGCKKSLIIGVLQVGKSEQSPRPRAFGVAPQRSHLARGSAGVKAREGLTTTARPQNKGAHVILLASEASFWA